MQPLALPSGFIDIHCHVLHGLDDGPPTLEMASRMCAMAHVSSTAAVISTPHASDRFAFDPETTARRRVELQQRLEHPLRLFAGCEVELSPEVLSVVLKHPVLYTLNESRYLLVELMPAGMTPRLDHVFGALLGQGVVPILAHPERHVQLNRERLAGWVRQGCLIQITAATLTERTSARARDTALDLLRARLVHFVASDGHDLLRRPPRLLDAFRAVNRMLSREIADLLFIRNPRAVLENQPIRSYPAF